jgi:hypothetical protein
MAAWLFLAAVAVSVSAGSVAAQPSESRALARDLFEEGLALSQADRWPEALSAFRRSAALAPRPSTSYNIANALYRLDRPVEALSALDEYDRMPEVQQDDRARRRGQELRSLLLDAVGEVELTVTPAAATLFVDGLPSVLEGRERRIVLNPGTHSMRVTHDGYEPDRRQVRVERGSRHAYSVELKARAATVPPPPTLSMSQSTIALSRDAESEPEKPVDDRTRFVKRPGFWVMIGVIAAAGIGAGVAVAVLRKDEGSDCGTTGSCATTQGLTVASF